KRGSRRRGTGGGQERGKIVDSEENFGESTDRRMRSTGSKKKTSDTYRKNKARSSKKCDENKGNKVQQERVFGSF
ncbi:hypothetical protein, partial [Yokenella regensburgei]|uniref:hypothetical protein n=1 Tax=Yokenella regensburgei TaxID=158877 RepID=UPI0020774F26